MPLSAGRLAIPRHSPPRILNTLFPSAGRQFHSSRQHNDVHAFLDTTTTVLNSVHDKTGLAWCTLIPLTAVGLRVAFTTPFTLYSRKQTEKVIGLLPLQNARVSTVAKNLARVVSSPQMWQRNLRLTALRDQKELWKRWGCQRWKLYLPFLQLPLWFSASATLRAMMPTSAEEESAGWLLRVFGGGGVSAESLTTEGLSWCIDLTIKDPTMTLPAVFGICMFINTRFQAWLTPARTNQQKVFVNSLSVLALAMVWIAKSAPAGLVLYWTASAAWSLLQNILLWRLWPMPKKIEPCKENVPSLL
jgi:inner membrane protein COX18